MELGNWWPSQESSKQSTDMETLSLANQQTQPIQTKICLIMSATEAGRDHAMATLGFSLIMSQTEQKSLKSKFPKVSPH